MKGMSSILCSGFTIMESVIVILLLTILAISIVPRIIDKSDIAASAAADMIASDIRQVQSAAMFGGHARTITFNGTSDYTAEGLNPPNRTLPGGVTAGPETITFNSFGEPISGAGGVSLCIEGCPYRAVIISALTGKVSIY